MTSPSAPDTGLLDRYLANECTLAERATVDAWAATVPERPLRLAALRRAVADPFGPVSFSALPELLQWIWNTIDAAKQGEPSEDTAVGGAARTRWETRPRGGRTRVPWVMGSNPVSRWWPALAVGALAVAVIGVTWRSGLFRTPARAPSMSTYATAAGERASITLPDGSTVVLNVASQLDIPTDYAMGNHTVRLTGEALFTVSHHDGPPFTVLAGGTSTRVLGTSFVVRHYAADTMVTVGVRDGKVSVHAGAIQSVVLTASHYIEVGEHGTARLGKTDGAMFSFATGVLTLRSTPLAQAMPELDRWYAAEVRLGDSSFARMPIEGEFAAGSQSDLANVLALMLHAQVVRNGRVLTLYPKAAR